ncbi:hypothetical protein Pfo_013567 [Paulownia fortunei]|nr:hypothetical protein Pfo_013567 [Paulownia fortunei]
MDLEIVGRHDLLFDDDATAAFVNSGDALVDWHSLQIDRYDVRHLLSSPPPPRRRNGNSEPILLDDLSLESQLDHERYLDLPSHSDQPEEDEHRPDTLGYRTVAFSYGNTDDSADQKNTDAGMESSGFLPRFPIPGNLRQCLPPTEKVHQIIARTAMFVSKHGGQSEFILRLKQGDNPSFGFLMPGHHLHAYFRFLVEHPELLLSESEGYSQGEQKQAGSKHNNSNGVDGALTLLGSFYGSGEEEEGDDTVKTEKDVSLDSTYSVNCSISHGSKKIESQADAAKDESVSRYPILSPKEKVLTVKKNSLITASKSGTVKGMEEKSRLFTAAADKAKSSTMGMTSKIKPLILEPPPELKRLIDKLVEFIMRNGKQFEATLIEQDSKHGRFPFLLPSNQYHSYYLKVLQTAQESKVNCKSFYSGKDDILGRGMDKKVSVLKEKDFSYLASDMPLESDRKEKFKMVIGKSKKESQETESKETQQECGIGAAAAAAIFQAATRGFKNSNLQIISITSPTDHVHLNSSEGGQPGNLCSLLRSKPDESVEKSGQSGSCNVSAADPKKISRAVSVEAAGEADSSEAHLTKEQKLKAERLKRAKMFVAMLKSGELPFTTGASRGSSLEPLECGVSRCASEVNPDVKKREGSLAPAADVDKPATDEKPERNYFGEEHSERLSKRKYRSRSGGCEDDDEDDDGDTKEHNERRSKRNCRSRSRRHDEGDENENAVETEQKHHRRRHRNHSSSEENEDEGEISEEDRDNKHCKLKHRSYHSQQEDECEDKYKEDKNHKRSRKKHRSHRSSREHSTKRRLSKQYVQEEDEHDHGRARKRSGKKHRSHRSRDKHGHRSERSSRDTESQHNLKHETSSDDEHQNHSSMDKHKKKLYDERNELEEGEISSRVSDESRGISNGHISVETSTDVVNSHQRAPSQPSETTAEVPDDLRAKIRAMLMATRL